MTKPKQLKNTASIKRVLQMQLVAILAYTAYMYSQYGLQPAQASILGCLVAWIAHSILAVYTFKLVSSQYASLVVNNFFKGQLIKWIFTISALAVIILYTAKQNTAYVILGFVFSQITNWLFIFVKK